MINEIDILHSVMLGLILWTTFNLGKVSGTLEAMRDKREDNI